MVSSQNILVQQVQQRHRLSLDGLASRLAVAVDALVPQTLDETLLRQVEALNQAPPKPLVAVADVLKAGGQQLRDELVNDARQLANKVLAHYQRYAYMNEQHETHLTALNHLRLYVYGNAEDTGHDYIVPQKVWQVVRPVEELLEGWVKANNYAAQSALHSKLVGAYAQLAYLRDTRLPHYEQDLGELPIVHAILEDFDQKFAALNEEVEAYNAWREHLAELAPLSFEHQGEDMRLAAQMPREAKAQAMAEEAIAALKTAQRTGQRNLRQQGKAREQEVMENLFYSLLTTLEAGDEPDKPTVTAVELDLDKATASTPKASPSASLRKVVGIPVPKAPKVKVSEEPATEEAPEEVAPHSTLAEHVTTGAAEAPQPIASPAAKSVAIQAQAADVLVKKPAEKAPHKVPAGARDKKEADLYKDTGHREPGWQAVDEKLLAIYLRKNKGYFSSKAAFAAIQRNIMALNRAHAMGFNATALKQLIKTLDWAGEDEPPLPT